MEFIRLARAVVRPLLRAISYIDIVGLENIPETGTAIVASNHLGRLDALLAVILSDREDFVIMIAEKYQKFWFWRWVMGELDALWLNRYEADFQTLKTVIKRMKSGQILGIAPEGTRSKTEALLEAKGRHRLSGSQNKCGGHSHCCLGYRRSGGGAASASLPQTHRPCAYWRAVYAAPHASRQST